MPAAGSPYQHTSIRVRDAHGRTTTVSVPDELLAKYVEYANGDIDLVRRKAREIARKCAKQPGLPFSVQVRMALEKCLRGHHIGT